MELWVYNENLEHIGILDSYASLILESYYCDVNKLSQLAYYSEQTATLLREGALLCRAPSAEDSEVEFFQLQKVFYKEGNRGEVTIEAKGFGLLYLLKHRILRQNFPQKMSLQSAMQAVFNHCYRGQVQETANIELRVLGNYSEEVELAEVQGRDLLQVFMSLCALKNLGLRVLTNLDEKKHYIEVYEGVNRSLDDENIYIVSDAFDNILGPSLSKDDELRKNAAYCVAEDVLYSVGTETGFARREIFLSTKISKTYKNASGQTVTRSAAELKRLIEAELTAELAKYKTEQSFTCKVLEKDFGQGYALGDLVRFEHKAWGIEQALRVSSVKENWQGAQIRVEIGLGDTPKGLLEQIKLRS